MNDPRSEADRRDRELVPYIVFVLLLIIGFIGFGVYGGVAVFLAFFAGRASIEKKLPFLQTLEEQRAEGRELLERLSPPELETIQKLLEAGEAGNAIREIRSLHSSGYRKAKNAIELLADFGDSWRESGNG